MITTVCRSCGAENPGGKRFCGDCATPLAAPAATAPRTVAGGRYELLRLLGEGGKKRVHLARDTVLDREVALALIKTDGLDGVGRTRVLREAQAMGSLGADPNVVAVFDLGDEGGQPYLVSELMAGGDLEGLLDRTPKRQLPIRDVIDLGIGIARGMAFAHEKGLIHRDLKPGNIWLTAKGIPKIGDFGLAIALGRSRLTQEGMIVGTVAYLPPEQALGGEVTPRADLYSLGALLYECLTGRPPFLGEDPVAIISQHINTPPVAPSWHRADCPKALEALVLRLLAKDPAARPESATDVLAALAAMERDPAAIAVARTEPDERSLDALSAGVFVGRRRELEILRAALEETLSGHGRMVTLVGEPGIGKTRTATEFTTYARLRRAQVLWGRCHELAGAPPYWPFVQAMRGYVREQEPDVLRRELGSVAAALAEILPELGTRLPGLPALPAAEPAQARFRLFDAVTAFLRAASADQPILLVLDDLHWADAGTLALLEFLARELEGARLLVLGTYRDVELTKGHPLAGTLAELTRERLYERVQLRGLEAADVGRFIAGTAGITPPEALVTAVYRHTEGNPLFVTEVVRLLVQEGALSPDRLAAKEQWSVRIPDGVREVIGRRLERLSDRCQEVLRTAAVIGREFSLDQLGALSPDLGEERLLAVVEEALAARVVEELPRAVGRFAFTHALIQDTLTAGLSATRRARLHAQIGETLEGLYGPRAVAHAAELAFHFGAARAVGGSAKFVHYALLAGEQALASYAYKDAVDLFTSVLAAREGSPDDAESASAMLGLGRAQQGTLDHELAAETLARAFEWYVGGGDVEGIAAVAKSRPWRELGDTLGNEDLSARALALVQPDSVAAGWLLTLEGSYWGLDRADYARASEIFERALAISRQSADPHLEMRVLLNWSIVDGMHLRTREAIERCLAAIDLAAQLRDQVSEALAHNMVEEVLCGLGDMMSARAHLNAGLALAEHLRSAQLLHSLYYDSAYLAVLEGDWLRAGIQIKSLNAVAPTGWAYVPRSLLQFQLGNHDAGSSLVEAFYEANRTSAPGRIQGSTRTAAPTTEIADLAFIAGFADWVSPGGGHFDRVAPLVERAFAARPVRPYVRLSAQYGEAFAAIARRDVGAAERLYEAVATHTGSAIFLNPFSFDHMLGMLAATMGRVDDALAHLDAALAFYRSAGRRPSYGWAAAEYVSILLDRDGPDDHPRALALGNEALEIGRELGMRPLVERVLSRREMLRA